MGRSKPTNDFKPCFASIAMRVVVAVLLLANATLAQEPATPEDPAPLPLIELPSREEVNSIIERLEKAEGETPPNEKLLEVQKKLLVQLDRIEDFKEQKETQQAQLAEATQRQAELEQILAEPPQPATPEIGDASTVSQLERRLAELEADRGLSMGTLADLEGQLTNLAERRKQLPELLATAKQKLEEARSERRSPPSADLEPELAEAQRVLNAAKERALEAEAQWLEQELPASDVRRPYLTLRRDLAVRKTAEFQRLIELFSSKLSEVRQREARAAASKARQEARALVPGATAEPEFREAVARLAEENKKVAEFRTGEEGPVQGIEKTTHAAARISDLLAQVKKDFGDVKERVDIAGRDRSLGELLRKHRAELPNYRQHQRNIRERQGRSAQAQIKRIDLREERFALADLDARVRMELSGIPAAASADRQAEREKAVRELLKTRRDYLDSLLSDYDVYIQELSNLDTNEKLLAEEAQRFAEFINENILWIPSGSAFSPSTLREALAGLRWLFDAQGWGGIGANLVADIRTSPLTGGLGWIAVALFFLMRPRWRARIRTLGKEAQRPLCVTMLPTFQSLFFTLLLAATGPALLLFAGWRLTAYSAGSDFARSIGYGAQIAGLVYFILEVFRQTLRSEGLAIAHFAWSESILAVVRKNLTWVLAFSVPLSLLYTTLQWYLAENYQESFGRLLFLANMVVLIVFAQRCLKPPAGAFGKLIDPKKTTEGVRIRIFWYCLGVGAPIIILALAFFGYYYTAFRLGARLFATLAFTLAAALVYAIFLRWLLLAKRKIKLDQLRKKREAAQAEDSASDKPEVELELEVDLERIDLQTRRLLRSCVAFVFVVGLWYIWEQELPAFSYLDTKGVWEIESIEKVVDDTGAEKSETVIEEITLADLALALLVAALTIAAMRNLPGLLEIALLQRLHLGQGERYALTTIARYLFLALGVVIGFQAVGIGWSKVQWLVAAVSLGLGFGLQEIFANFISGLIILFERPMRVGDTVMVGETLGQVSKINIRATTIVDFDRKELIVPNKEFVTGQLINWSLSDQVIRQIIEVGIAYGADTELAEKTLYQVAKDDPLVMEDPPPRVVFNSFGESSLDFELRVFTKDVDDYIVARHRLHMDIDRAFRKAGIEIAFPQRDLHLRSSDVPLTKGS
jgi:potassium efflux system protein